MPFPPSERIIFKKNPLVQVLCQLKFPPILRIDTEIPSQFQDLIRARFPLYTVKPEGNLDIPDNIAETIPPEILRSFNLGPVKQNHEFVSENGDLKINLTSSFVALTANSYERWESFSESLDVAIRAVTEVYSPANYSRIGLRYIDVIDRDELALEGTEWGQLLNVHILSLAGSEITAGHVINHNSEHLIALDNGTSVVKIRTKFVTDAENDNRKFLIDSDFSENNTTPIEDASALLSYFNIRSSRFIQWCISEKLKSAMEGQLLK